MLGLGRGGAYSSSPRHPIRSPGFGVAPWLGLFEAPTPGRAAPALFSAAGVFRHFRAMASAGLRKPTQRPSELFDAPRANSESWWAMRALITVCMCMNAPARGGLPLSFLLDFDSVMTLPALVRCGKSSRPVVSPTGRGARDQYGVPPRIGIHPARIACAIRSEHQREEREESCP
jgi:hypothetical protein